MNAKHMAYTDDYDDKEKRRRKKQYNKHQMLRILKSNLSHKDVALDVFNIIRKNRQLIIVDNDDFHF